MGYSQNSPCSNTTACFGMTPGWVQGGGLCSPDRARCRFVDEQALEIWGTGFSISRSLQIRLVFWEHWEIFVLSFLFTGVHSAKYFAFGTSGLRHDPPSATVVGDVFFWVSRLGPDLLGYFVFMQTKFLRYDCWAGQPYPIQPRRRSRILSKFKG